MSKNNDINDDEIRVISSGQNQNVKSANWFLAIVVPIIALLVLGVVLTVVYLWPSNEEVELQESLVTPEVVQESVLEPVDDVLSFVKSYTTAKDTVINNRGVKIITPENARARLVLGTESLNDSTIVLAMQAADIRGDNGQIAGTFVLNGELISKGDAKAGFCSIVNGELTLGVADATPMLEQSLTEGGYFFRQYPLVVGSQIVENKPKGKAIRKALAEIGGRICVVISKEKLTFHDFSESLTDIGARNAIYLVGSASYGFYVEENGNRFLTGPIPTQNGENVSYIIWE